MKIVIVTQTIYPDLWWWELYMFNLAKELIQQWHSVDVLCISELEWISDQNIWGVNFFYLKKSIFMGKAFPSFFQIVKKMTKKEYDLIYTSGPAIPDFLIVLLNLFLRKKLIMTYHAMHDQTKWRLRWMTAMYLICVLPFYDSIIVTTKKYYDILKKRGIKNIHNIPCGVASDRLKLWNFNKENKKELLFVWVLDENHRYKNLKTLLDAMVLLEGYHLTVVGGGVLKDKYQQYCLDNNINGVDFLWAITDEELSLCYKKANTFILPSNSSLEWFWIVLLEALGNWCKIITGELAWWSFLVRENPQFWFLYDGTEKDLVDKIRRLEDSHSLSQEDISQYLSQYNWSNITKKILDTLN